MLYVNEYLQFFSDIKIQLGMYRHPSEEYLADIYAAQVNHFD